ncbi:Ribosomal protein S27a [Ostertagia ostertagi]
MESALLLHAPKGAEFDSSDTKKWRVNHHTIPGGYTPSIMLAGIFLMSSLSLDSRDHGKQVLSIGLGGGSVDMVLSSIKPEVNVTVVELDSLVVTLASKWFGVTESIHHHTVVQNGVNFLEKATERGTLVINTVTTKDKDTDCVKYWVRGRNDLRQDSFGSDIGPRCQRCLKHQVFNRRTRRIAVEDQSGYLRRVVVESSDRLQMTSSALDSMMRENVEQSLLLHCIAEVDDNGKIRRLRKECQSPTCGGGVFMAAHENRYYCGRCHDTLVVEEPVASSKGKGGKGKK